MEKASNYGQLFQYIPEFYVETVLQSMYALHCYFNPIINVEEIRGKLVFFKTYSLNYSMFFIKNINKMNFGFLGL